MDNEDEKEVGKGGDTRLGTVGCLGVKTNLAVL